MAKTLASKSWDEIEREMSIAGDPELVVEIMKDIFSRILDRLDMRNLPTIDNVQFGLERIQAELRLMERMERQRQHPE